MLVRFFPTPPWDFGGVAFWANLPKKYASLRGFAGL